MPPGFDFLLEMERFRELMIKQMETTAAEELSAKIDTKKLEASNEHLKERIKGMEIQALHEIYTLTA